MKKRVVFRADGSPKIGYGHVYRMLSLAEFIKGDFDCLFVSHESPNSLLEALEELHIPFKNVPRLAYKTPDERLPNEEVSFDMQDIIIGDEIVVLDGYWFGVNYQRAIKRKGAFVVCIDDLADSPFVADVVINPNPGIRIRDYWGKSPFASFFLGLDFVLINVDRRFKRSAQTPGISSCILIAMGASDPSNATCAVLKAYQAYLELFQEVVVLIGKAFGYLDDLLEISRTSKNLTVVSELSKSDVYALMNRCPFAILSASTMAIEYAQIGGFLGLVQTAKNQKFLFEGLIDRGMALPAHQMAERIDEYALLRENQAANFDGRSGERIAVVFKELETFEKIQLIMVSDQHLEITYQWASDPSIRKYSFNHNKISFSEHREWFAKKLKDDNCRYFIGFLEGNAVGTVRFDINLNKAVISYLVDPGCQGRGFGRCLLTKGIALLCETGSNVDILEGFVLPENVPSIRIFEKMAFQHEMLIDRIRYYKSLKVNGTNQDC